MPSERARARWTKRFTWSSDETELSGHVVHSVAAAAGAIEPVWQRLRARERAGKRARVANAAPNEGEPARGLSLLRRKCAGCADSARRCSRGILRTAAPFGWRQCTDTGKKQTMKVPVGHQEHLLAPVESAKAGGVSENSVGRTANLSKSLQRTAPQQWHRLHSAG